MCARPDGRCAYRDQQSSGRMPESQANSGGPSHRWIHHTLHCNTETGNWSSASMILVRRVMCPFKTSGLRGLWYCCLQLSFENGSPNVTVNTALHWVLSNTPDKCEAHRMNGCWENLNGVHTENLSIIVRYCCRTTHYASSGDKSYFAGVKLFCHVEFINNI